MTTIAELIESGKGKIEKDIAEKVRLDGIYKAHVDGYETALKQLTLALIPEALHPFAQIVDGKILEIDVPGCARITCQLSVDSSSAWDQDLKQWCAKLNAVELDMRLPDGGWSVRNWAVYDEDGDALMWSFRVDHAFTDDIEWALAFAADIGDNRAQVEAEVASKNAARPFARESDPKEPTALHCPLLGGDCKREACALWVRHRGCAIQVIALDGAVYDGH